MTSRVAVTWLAVLLAAMTLRGTAVSVDRTVEEGVTGPTVVDAVINRIREKCVFPEDRLFLRRLAYVASGDGLNAASNSYGGMWQINEAQLLSTKNCPASTTISAACQAISDEFAIDWPGTVTLSDLSKPLYSGLAAALYALVQLNGAAMPGDVSLQAQFYATAFGGNATEFAALASNATSLDCAHKMDVVFVLDSSGSVTYPNFNLMRSFTADIVEVMAVDGDAVRVSDIVYGSNVKIVFNLNNYSTAQEIKDAIRDTPKLGGGTMTNDAIDVATSALYDANRGARSDAKKVLVLVTDGHSFQPDLTEDSAQSLRDRGTTLFTIGVGAYNLTELHQVASETSCSHVLTLTQFSNIQSILTQIQHGTCSASLALTPGKSVTGEIRDPPVELVTRTINTGPNRKIVANVTCGTLDLYLSYTDQNPSSALHEESYSATHGAPVTMTTSPTLEEGSAVYVTLLATRMTSEEASLNGCSQYTWGIAVEEPTKVVRLKNGARDTEGRVEIFANGAWGTVCGNNFDVNDAIVACRMLGYERFVPVVMTGDAYGSGQGAIWMDDVQCQGAESSLWVCNHTSQMQHDCRHTLDVGIDCQHPNASALRLVRLENGSRASEGRLEVWNGGSWGTVCSDTFDVMDATVACNMLNYTGSVPAILSTASFDEASGDIWLDDLNCQGTELSIFLCPHAGVAVHNCTHQKDVGVDCQPPGANAAGSSQDTGSSSDQTAAIAGATAGSLLVLLAAGGAVWKYLAHRAATVENFQSGSNGADARGPSRMERRSSSASSMSDTVLPGQADAIPSLKPAETRLPPISNSNAVRFPALRS